MDGYDNNSGRKTGRRSYTFPSKGSRSNVSPKDKLIKRERERERDILYFSYYEANIYITKHSCAIGHTFKTYSADKIGNAKIIADRYIS